jgi:outer membrane protein insertion porin family
MKNKFLLYSLFLLSLNAVSLSTIENIKVSGNINLSKDTIVKSLPIKKGQIYNLDNARLMLGSLYETGDYEDITISLESQTVLIELKENPFLNKINFFNFDEDGIFTPDIIDQLKNTTKLLPGERFSKEKLAILITSIQDYYLDNGYYNIKVLDRVIKNNNGDINLEIYVKEGLVAKVTKMEINGNHYFSTDKLLSLFDLGKPDVFFINFFSKKDDFSKIKLDEGIVKLQDLYLNNGFTSIALTKINPVLSEDKLSVEIEIEINEGDQRFVDDIHFPGKYTPKEIISLESTFGMKAGDIMNRKKIIEGIDSINKKYSNLGFIFANVEVDSKNRLNNKTNLIVKITKNKIVSVDSIKVSGNKRTKKEVILRELVFNENELYSEKKVNDSVTNLKRLGFFETVDLNIIKIPNSDDKVNLELNVKEAKTGEFQMGLAHNFETGTAFNLGMKEKNLFGTGNELNAVLSQSEAVKELDLFFKDPHFNERGDSIQYGGFFKKLDADSLGGSDYTLNNAGLSFGYGRKTEDKSVISANLKLSDTTILCSNDFANIYESSQCSSNDTSEVLASLNYSNNTIDDYFNPTTGSINKAKLDIALPFGDFKYFKIDASHSAYTKLDNRFTLNTKASLGWAKGYGGKELPFFKRYFGGGNNSVRGFDFNSLGTKYSGSDIAKGGELSLLSSISASTKLDFIKGGDNIKMGFFGDVGGVFEKTSDLNFSDMKASVGIGFSIGTPIGPIGVYAAKPIISKADDKIKNIEVTFGTTF